MVKKTASTCFMCLFLLLVYCMSATVGILSVASAQEKKGYYYMPDYSPIFWSGPNNSKQIALTFDDGPDPIYTPKILDVLAKYNVKATFFVVGEMAALTPQLVQRIIAEGHEVASHTMTHPDGNTPPLKLHAEVLKSITYLQNLTHQPIHFFRPPYGYLNAAYFSACADQKISCI